MTRRISTLPQIGRGGCCPGLHLTGHLPLLLAAILLPLAVHATAAQPIRAVFGGEIPLGGTATGADVIYLFLTGPNLPPQGISLVGGTPVVTGDPSSFTGVDVLTDGTWAYTWDTRSIGRILDPGTYVIYIVQEPRSLPDLDDAVYATQPVVFGSPVETLTVPLEETVTPAVNPSSGTPVVFPPGHPVETATPGQRSPPQPSTPTGRLAIPSFVPLAAAALAILGFRRRF